jgi:putative Mg2+ transporter-C (MgtC) family protein
MHYSLELELVFRLILAALLGSAVGLERERLSWAAGLRTHMLVALGSCLFMIVSIYGFNEVLTNPAIHLDPSRVAAQVVSGIGFLGAGAIILRGEIIRGLTTAASLWSVAAIGLAVGGGMYVEATATMVLMLIILAGVKPLEERYRDKTQAFEIHVLATRGEFTFETLRKALGHGTERIRQFIIKHSENPELDEIVLVLGRMNVKDVAEMMAHIRKLACTKEVKDTRL